MLLLAVFVGDKSISRVLGRVHVRLLFLSSLLGLATSLGWVHDS